MPFVLTISFHHLNNKTIMILNKLKHLIISIAFLIHTDLKADWTINASNNLTAPVTFYVYNASNVLLATSGTIAGLSTWPLGCTPGVPTSIRVIDAGGCLLNIINLNSSGSCSTCSGCTGFPTTTTFACSETLTALCAPVTHVITLSIDP